MHNFYLFCAIFGGAFVVLQFLMTLMGGLGGEDASDVSDATIETEAGDASFDSETGEGAEDTFHEEMGRGGSATDLLKILSVRTITAAMAFFGLVGLAGQSAEMSNTLTLIISLIAGLFALILVYFLYRFIRSFNYDGSVKDTTLLNCAGTVYIRIPANEKGVGKVMVNQQDRTMEYEAVTQCDQEIKSGTPIVVVKILSSNQVVVVPKE
ncbi:MAG: hypothetical protein Q4C95_11615 [Planctomycetia bacterium]|nr:hypothetical protein [Planctomycetia bacterium]